MGEKPKPIAEFKAIVKKVQDLDDHGIRLTLDLEEHESVVMAKMHECKINDVVIWVVVTAKE